MKLADSRSMMAMDKKAIKDYGVKGIILMENAGRAASEIVRRELLPLGRAAVVAGSGNNGGDGFVCARHLKNANIDTLVFLVGNPEDIKGDATVNAKILKKMGVEIHPIRSVRELEKHVLSLRHSSVIVDAIFGTGLTRPVIGIHAAVIEAINKLGKQVVSIDVPSGLDASTGKILGCAIKATVTATLALAKAGLYIYPGRSYAGRVEVMDIGMPSNVIKDTKTGLNLIDDVMMKAILKPRKADTHKGACGHLLIIGGSIGKTGAAYMAGIGAMRVGAGLTTIALPKSLNAIMEMKTTEVMTLPLSEKNGSIHEELAASEAFKALKGKSALVIGPGLGLSVIGGHHAPAEGSFIHGIIERCADWAIPAVIDADALTAFKGKIAALKNLTKKGARLILTPHPGEAARLLGITTDMIQDDRIGSARALSEKTGAVVALKGAATIVASSEDIYINPTGNPGMATAGTGDILSGMIGGLLAQGIRPLEAALCSVYIHGMAGDGAALKRGEIGLMATDILDEIPPLLNSFARG